MKCRKLMSGVLAAAMVVTSVFTGDVITAKADVMPIPVATYGFDGTIDSAAAILKGLGSYTGEVSYTTGHTGAEGDQAVQLNGYGIELAEKNVGSEYTLNFWVKSNGSIVLNTPVAFLGYNSPEKWVAISGIDGSANAKVWTNEENNNSYSWTTLDGTLDLGTDTWKMVTVTQSGEALSVYVDGALASSGSAAEALNGENQGIILGTSNWDAAVSAAYDDVSLYKQAMTETQVEALYNGQPTPKAIYDFNGNIGTAAAITTGLGAYTGDVTYGVGRTGQDSDQAVQLGEYGLQLAEMNLGIDYTVNFWAKADGTIAENMPALFLGYHSPEKWLAIAGSNGTNTCKVWTKEDGTAYSWTTVGTTDVATEWQMYTVSQSGENLSVYVNGELAVSGNAAEALNGENQGIYLGVNNWDNEFTGLVDDVAVYGQALTAAEVAYIYDGGSAESVLDQKGITVKDSLNLKAGATANVGLGLPSAVDPASCTISYVSDNEAAATVDTAGLVTAVAAGTANITTTVTLGAVTKTATTVVTVSDFVATEYAVNYDLTGTVDGELVDTSGNGNNATVHGTPTFADGVMTIASDDTYMDLPMGIMDSLTNPEEFTIHTTFSKSAACGNNAWLYCLGSAIKGTGTNYLFLSPNFSNTTLRAGIKNSSTEKLFATSIAPENGKTYSVDMVFNNGSVKLYLNGVVIDGELKSGYSIMDDVVTPGSVNNILGYIGNSCWSADKRFQGTISEFSIYNKAMTDEEVQNTYADTFQQEIEDALTISDVLGQNASADDVRYNLSMPTSVTEIPLTWESSNTDVISASGTVANVAEATQVTVTATATSGVLVAKVSFTLTVQPADRSALDTILTEANAALADTTNFSDASVTVLKNAVDKASGATTQTEIDARVKAIRRAIDGLETSALYRDPFVAIDEASLVKEKTVAPGATATIFTLPESIKDMVTVTYASSNEAVATYKNGVVTGVKVGYARVTATVTAKSDGFAMEYQALVNVAVDMTKVTAKAAKTKIAKGSTTKITVSIPAAIKSLNPTTTYRATGAVSVSKAGKVTGKSAGTGKVYVKVKAAGKSITKTLTIKVGAVSGKSSVKVKKSITLKVKGISASGVKWSVSNTKLAKISSKGKLTGKKAGKVVVTAKVGSVTMKKTVTIKK